MGEVKGQDHIFDLTSNRCTFRVKSIGTAIPKIWQKVCLTLKKIRKFVGKSAKKVSNRIPPKSNQVISMTRGTLWPSFVVIWLGVLTLSCRKAVCQSSPKPRPLVKVTERSSGTFSRRILSLSQISNLLQRCLKNSGDGDGNELKTLSPQTGLTENNAMSSLISILLVVFVSLNWQLSFQWQKCFTVFRFE